MSERKTEVFRLRLTPDEKVRWQAAADKEGVSLSELIRVAMQEYGQFGKPPMQDIAMLDPDTSQFTTMLAELPPVECSVMPSGCWALKEGRPCPCNPKSEYQVIDKPLPETERTEQTAPSEPYGSSWKPFGTDRVG